MKLALPLKYYDDAGRIKPPIMLYVIVLFLCRPLIVFIASISFRQDGGLLLSIFYPVKYHFYLALVHAIPALALLLFINFREKLWKHKCAGVFKILPAVFVVLLGLDTAVQLYILNAQSFAFKWSFAFSFVGLIVATLFVAKSYHLKLMNADYRLNE